MTVKRGEIWLADLNPIRGSEQAGVRPVLIFQSDTIRQVYDNRVSHPIHDKFTPCFAAFMRARFAKQTSSVALCHQLRALDRTRLQHKLGIVRQDTLSAIENCVSFTMGII